MPLQQGQVLNNRYRIVKLLGQGGMGAVYRAWDLVLQRPCALKENLDHSPEAQRQFTREAMVLAGLSHPNLPNVNDYFSVEGQGQYLIMEFVDGEDLESLVQRSGAILADQALVWVSQVLDALRYLHGQKPPVFHRDIKPANIRIAPDGRAMLVDFGLVKVYEAGGSTTIGARAVTPGYSPPEQYGRGTTDGRSDVYALGATLYTLLTGQQPLESVQRMAGASMPTVYQLNTHVQPTISAIVDRAMSLTPSQRFQDSEQFSRSVHAYLSGSTEASTSEISSRPKQTAGDSAPARPPVQSTEAISKPPEDRYGQPVDRTAYVAPRQSAQARRQAEAAQPGVSAPYPGGQAAVPSKKTNWLYWLFGAGAIFLLVLGAMAVVGGVIITNQRATATEEARRTMVAFGLTSTSISGTETEHAKETERAQTATAAYQQTQTAEAELTETAIAARTATAISAIATDNALATDQALAPDLGPVSGELAHDPDDGFVAVYSTDFQVMDFVAEVRFYNPYSASFNNWDCGLFFRDLGKDKEFRLVIRSEKEWRLLIRDDQDKSETLQEGVLPGLNTESGESNFIRLIADGNQGFFYLNGDFITELDLSALMEPGWISVGTGFYTNREISGYTTLYEDFTVWNND